MMHLAIYKIMSLYKLHNQYDSVLNIDNAEIFKYILNKYNMTDESDEDVIELLKDITRDPKKLHEISVETMVTIYDILQIIVIEMPDIVDKRFLTRMKKLYNTKS